MPGWELVLRALSEKRASALRVLLSSSDPHELLRAQGRFNGLDEAIRIREVLLVKPVRRP